MTETQSIQAFIDSNNQWTIETFPEGTATSALEHLAKEVRETIEAIANESPEAQREEFADCFLLLMNAATKNGMSFSELFEESMRKMELNRRRKWGKPNAIGVVEHIEDENRQTCTDCGLPLFPHEILEFKNKCEDCYLED